MKFSIFFSFLVVIAYSCSSSIEDTETLTNDTTSISEENTDINTSNEQQPPNVASTYTVEPFEKGKNDWGYRIMNGDVLFINQPHIPAAQGNLGFSTKEKAITAGNFMIYKLTAGIVPPTVSIEELDSLGVLD